ncbi:VWA domain-containing protein [Vibrio nomapromontoriensis]|uniref:VWA domain-containing protein n=1 Tax=Vibrio nomapromontoriensis TaxID=2910246 RepID=UPI003D0E2892
MLGADSLNLAMMVAESGIIDSAVRDIVQQTDLLAMGSDEGVKQSFTASMAKWTKSVKRKLIKDNGTDELQVELTLYQHVVYLSEREFQEELTHVVSQIPQQSPFYENAQRLSSNPHSLPESLFARQFCKYWYESLVSAVEDKQRETLDEQKSKYLKQLYQKIETIKDMDNLHKEGSGHTLGRLWDLAGSELTKQDWKHIERAAEYLEKNAELKKIADQLGRMAQDVDAPELNKAECVDNVVVEEKCDFATDDIVGIHESNDINKMLPNEAMYLADPALETVFYQHLVEKRLLTYKAQGKQRTVRQWQTPTQANGHADKEKGPMVIAVDASGSMHGAPEKSAKAMAYSLMKMASEQKRECHVILFSSTFITYDLTAANGLKEASDFLSYSFKGGTDLSKVLRYAVDVMQGDQYKNADLLVISDFITPKQDSETITKVLSLKGRYNRFHSLCLSKYGNPDVLDLFDNQWRYHPSLVGQFIKNTSLKLHRETPRFASTMG